MTDEEVFELRHFGVKGMRWGVRRDERFLSDKDKALNLSQRSQVKLASGISALAAIGISSNAAATAFQLQSRWEHLQIAKAVADQAEHLSFLSGHEREVIRATKNNIIKGLVGSALMTTAISTAIGVVTHRTAKAYFAPIHKVYGDAKPNINRDLKKLSKDIKAGKRPSLTTKQYHAEVSKIVERHMTKNLSNVLSPFHELARSQLGLEYNTKKLNITFSKLPNTDLAEKMTITSPTGLKLVKALKTVEHSALGEAEDLAPDLDLYFDYKFDDDGYISEWSSPTIELAHNMFEGNFKISQAEEFQHADEEVFELRHFGVKGMKWGVRKDASGSSGVSSQRLAVARGKVVAAAKDPRVRTAIAVARVGAAPVGTALATVGLGVPAVLAVGISVRVFNDPAVQQLLGLANDYRKLATEELGLTELSTIERTKARANVNYAFRNN